MTKRLRLAVVLAVLTSEARLPPAALAQDSNPPGILRAPIVDGWPDLSAAIDSVGASASAVRVIDDPGASLDDRRAILHEAAVRTLTQMLLVAAEIRRYRWQHGQPPASLDDLKIGKNAIDKFTGKPFDYERLTGQNYKRASVGPADPSPSAGGDATHLPLTFADERKPLTP